MPHPATLRRLWLKTALAQAGGLALGSAWQAAWAADGVNAASVGSSSEGHRHLGKVTGTGTGADSASNTGAPPSSPHTTPSAHRSDGPPLQPGLVLSFPRDHGAHPAFRTEWWYATGALHTQAGEALGFQVTFFRSRVAAKPPARVSATVPTPGRFEPAHLLFAHGALTDVAGQQHLHGQRLGRWNGDPTVRPDHATLADTHLQLGGWSLARRDLPGGRSAYQTRLADDAFALDLTLTTTQPLLLQGEAGLSRKGPDPAQASGYYTQPQLAVVGQVRRQGRTDAVQGTAWLDHEWSESLLHPDAVGWDWVGMNLANGAALTAFQLRRADGTAVWAGGSWRPAGTQVARNLAPTDLRWQPLRWWVSPQSGARYPVRWRLETPAGAFEVQAVMDAQELDSRQSTGTVYWEGLSTLHDGRTGQHVGQGYLEMTGYAGRLRL